MVFMDGLYEEIQQHLFQNQVTTIVDAIHLTRVFYLARSLTLRNAPIPREMPYERLKGNHVTAIALNRIGSRSSLSSYHGSSQLAHGNSKSPRHHRSSREQKQLSQRGFPFSYFARLNTTGFSRSAQAGKSHR